MGSSLILPTAARQTNAKMRLISPGEYIRAIKELRKYADGFTADDGYDLRKVKASKDRVALTPAQKKRVKSYFDVLQRHAGYKGTKFQKFENKKKLKEAQAVMGMPTKGTWRGVFVPQPEAHKAKLKKVRGTWVVSFGDLGVESVFVPFDKVQFASRGIEYVREIVAIWPDDWRYNLDMGYGRERWKIGHTKRAFLDDLAWLIERNLSGQSGTSSFEDYMLGVHVYRSASQTSQEYQQLYRDTMGEIHAKRAQQEALKAQIAKERRLFRSIKEREKQAKQREVLKALSRDERREIRQAKKFLKKYGI